MEKAVYPDCQTCGHLIGHYNSRTRIYNDVCYCGCTDWVPLNNLEYLEWSLDKKEKVNE